MKHKPYLDVVQNLLRSKLLVHNNTPQQAFCRVILICLGLFATVMVLFTTIFLVKENSSITT